jgi:hypothetical protein
LIFEVKDKLKAANLYKKIIESKPLVSVYRKKADAFEKVQSVPFNDKSWDTVGTMLRFIGMGLYQQYDYIQFAEVFDADGHNLNSYSRLQASVLLILVPDIHRFPKTSCRCRKRR